MTFVPLLQNDMLSALQGRDDAALQEQAALRDELEQLRKELQAERDAASGVRMEERANCMASFRQALAAEKRKAARGPKELGQFANFQNRDWRN